MDDKQKELLKKQEEVKRNKLIDLNEKIIEANNEISEYKKELKVTKDLSQISKLNKNITILQNKKIFLRKKIKKIKFKKIKNWFKFKTKYSELMYSPGRSSLLFRIFIITIAAIIATFSLHFFVHPGRSLYTGGLRTVQQIILFGASDSLPEWSTYLIFFAMNIPLAYFGWKYIGKWFTLLTLYFLVIQSGFEELLNVPYLKEHLENIYIIEINSFGQITSGNASIYISAGVGALIYGFGLALTFVTGASAGGTKFIVAWLQKKYQFSLGKSSMYIALVMIALGLLINGMIIDGKNFFDAYLATSTFATIVFIVTQAFVQNAFAPRTKKTSIKIVTTNMEKVFEVIDSTILSKREWYTYKIKKNKEKKESTVIVLTVDRRESEFVIGKLTRRLPTSQITYNDVHLHSSKFIVRGFD